MMVAKDLCTVLFSLGEQLTDEHKAKLQASAAVPPHVAHTLALQARQALHVGQPRVPENRTSPTPLAQGFVQSLATEQAAKEQLLIDTSKITTFWKASMPYFRLFTLRMHQADSLMLRVL